GGRVLGDGWGRAVVHGGQDTDSDQGGGHGTAPGGKQERTVHGRFDVGWPSPGSRMRQAGTVRLPVMPPLSPMLAKSADELPLGEGWLYEPKWDGFRCVVFRDGAEVVLDSRNERPLTRYFPELLEPLQACLPERCVVDTELAVPGPAGLDFDARP